jgi:type I restriction enzyme S subunit
MQQWQFSANFMGLGVLVDKAAIVLKTDEPPNIVSSAYPVFEVIDDNLLNPEYLMMWFRRSEFDRYCVFKSDKGIRGGFDWNDLCEVELPVPPIEKQNEIVKEYNTIVNRIKLNEQLNERLEDTAQALYKHWFVDFEFPNENGQPYKSSGGEMFYDDELDNDIPIGWRSVYLKDVTTKIGSGSTPRGGKESYKNSGISLIRSMNVYDFNFKMDDLAFIDENQAEKLKNVEVLNGDVLFNITGASVARCCIVPRSILPSRVNQHVAILRMSEKLSNYLLCAMCYSGSKRELIGVAESGSTREAITKEDLQYFRILMPSETLGKLFESNVEKLFKHKEILHSEHECLNEVKELLLSKMSKVESPKTKQVL